METRDKYYNYSPMMIPAPITDYNAGDRINKQFPNTCGPYPDTGGCGEAVTTFSGVITGNTSDIVENGIKVGQEFEVEWDMAPGMPTYPMFTYENPANMFLLSRGKSQPVNWTPSSQADCGEGETFIEAVNPPCNTEFSTGVNPQTGEPLPCPPVTPAYCSSEVIRPTGEITPTTAGTTSKSILPILVIGGLMYYLYTKNN